MHLVRPVIRAILLLLIPFSCSFALFNTNDTTKTALIVPRINSDIKIDAVLDEPYWQDALVIEANIEVRPGENIPAPVQTEALIMYDDENLYCGFRCYDPEPEKIRAHFCDRDDIWDDDWILILFDTFNDNQRSYDFFSNPYGIQADEIESSAGGGGSWDAIWNSHGRITDEGYIVEMSIPFSSLGFQRSPEDQIWGVDIVRSYPRNVRHHIGAFPRDRDNNCYLCQAIKLVGFKGAKPGRDIELAPTLSGIHSSEREDGIHTPMQLKSREMEAGLTARFGLTPNLIMNGTINPDFSQVEADIKQLDINRQFAIYYNEKRPFFLEGNDFFSTLSNGVYTRSLADPVGGIKLTGKEGNHTIGFFSVQDKITNFIFPGPEGSDSGSLEQQNTSSVMRYKYDVGESSNIGMLVTDREGKDYYSRLGSIDATLKLTQKDELVFQVLNSSTQYPDSIINEYDQKQGTISGTSITSYYEHDTRKYNVYGYYSQVSPDYRADLGFTTRSGYHYTEAGGTWKWRRDPGSWFTQITWYGSYDLRRDWQYRPMHKAFTSRIYYEGPWQIYAGAYFEHGRDIFEGDSYRMNNVQFWTGSRPSGFIRLSLWGEYGDDIDYCNNRPGTSLNLSPTIELRPGKHLNLEMGHTWEKLDVAPGRLYTANSSKFKVIYQFSKRIFVRAILQKMVYDCNVSLYKDDDVDPKEKTFFSQLLFSYKINPQTVLFLGYSDNYWGDHVDPLTRTDRVFFAKMGYAWRI